MTKATCFLNGRYIPVAKAVIPAVDRGFLFGEGLFETWRTYNGRPFALRQHLERMRKSARALGIPFDPGEPWESRTRRLARINQMVEGGGAVRLTITRGSGPVSLVPGEPVNPTRLMLFRPLESGLAEARENGVAVHLMAFGPGVNPALRKLKTLNYLPAVMGKVAARKLGCFESLYRLDDSTVLEGTTSNYFIVRSGKLITPPVGGGVLPGITRAMVMQIASRLINIEEQVLKVADLRSADEMFITSSSIEVLPVTRVDDFAVATGQIGEFTRELQRRYRRKVARSLGLRLDQLGE